MQFSILIDREINVWEVQFLDENLIANVEKIAKNCQFNYIVEKFVFYNLSYSWLRNWKPKNYLNFLLHFWLNMFL